MNITLITLATPYKENKRAACALPYHLLKHRDKDLNVRIFTYNHNLLSKEDICKVEEELNVEIKLLHYPRWIKWMLFLHITFLKVFLHLPLFSYFRLRKREVHKICASKPDAIWVYSTEFVKILEQFEEIPCLMTLPDSVSLYYYRRMNVAFSFNHLGVLLKDLLMYRKYIHLEQRYSAAKNRWYHVVGEEDCNELKRINPEVDAFFVHHPTYNVKDAERPIHFSAPKIRLLLAGQYNYYMQQSGDELIEALCKDDELQLRYEITILGKGWEKAVNKLRSAGYLTTHIKFAPNYIEEICQHDIQITPITIGTGTKGKVLDAFANGLLVIGTPYALENIAAKPGKECLRYQYAAEAIELLKKVAADRVRYEQMAERGRESVLKVHERGLCSKQLFGIIKK